MGHGQYNKFSCAQQDLTPRDFKHKSNKRKTLHFSAYPGQLVPLEVHPAHIVCRLQEHSSQSERRPRPLLTTLHQIQTFVVFKYKTHTKNIRHTPTDVDSSVLSIKTSMSREEGITLLQENHNTNLSQ